MAQTIRVMLPTDLPAVNILLRRAYRNPANDYMPRMLRHLELEPEGWFVVERDGAIIASGGGTVMGNVGYVGLIGVDPDLHRQGIGAELMRELIGFLRAQGCETLLLNASDMGLGLYLKLGFVIEDQATIWHADSAKPLPGAAPDTINVAPLRASDLPALLAYDAAVFGAPRERVVAAYLSDTPETTWVARDASGALQGYLALVSAQGFIGPWLGSEQEAAAALLRVAMAQPSAHITTTHTPDCDHKAAHLLRAAGFAPVRSLAYMRLGEPLTGAHREMIYGQINLALG